MTDVEETVLHLLETCGSKQIVETCLLCKPCITHPAILGENTTFIVAAVLFDDKGQVLLIQEAKRSYFEKWYLPAGRVDKHETLIDAVKREVLEESGFHIEPDGLVCIESDGPYWMRFVFAGKIIGGRLKHKSMADSESIQAQWYDKIEPKLLRSRDILNLIDRARKYHMKFGEGNKHIKIFPVETKHTLMLFRILLLFEGEYDSYFLSVLQHDHFYGLPISCYTAKAETLDMTIKNVLSKYVVDTHVSGNKVLFDEYRIFGVEHSPSPLNQPQTDGMIINIQVKARHANLKSNALPRLKVNLKAKWQKIYKRSYITKLVRNNVALDVNFVNLNSPTTTSTSTSTSK